MSSKQALAIAIGNTHLKASIIMASAPGSEAETGQYRDRQTTTYTLRHDEIEQFARELDPSLKFKNFTKIAIASVVPHISTPWHKLPQTQIITIDQIPIAKLYETIGIDRALVALGAGTKYGYPTLVIDTGTAITITGIDDTPAFVGGAILPGLYVQLQSLHQATAALPEIRLEPAERSALSRLNASSDQEKREKANSRPDRWGTDTASSIQSGVINTIVAGLSSFIQDWCDRYPHSSIVITGGDGKLIHQYLNLGKFDPDLIFTGILQLDDFNTGSK
jgi:type III pantothenate kinase